jgi:cytochrome P450
LIELAKNPEIQKKLRRELKTLASDDPSYEQLTSELPYLDAVMMETLRLHPSLLELTREAS